MSKKIKAISFVLSICMVLGLTACGGNNAKDGKAVQVKTIKFAHWFAEDHPQHLAMLKFKELLEKRSNGSLKVQIYPNSQLGSEDAYDQSVSQGTVEMGCAGTNIQMYLPKIAVSEAPFLFNGWKDAEAILRGEIGKELTNGLIKGGNMRCLQITVNGWRQISTNRELRKMSDFHGQKLRTPNIPHFIKMMDCLGATSVPMAMSEIFNALETKVVDGQENPYPTIFTSSFYEVQKYILESNHMFSPNFWVINEQFYQGLTAEQKKALESSLAEAAAYNWEISKKYNEDAKKNIQSKGTTEIIVPNDTFKKELRTAVEPVYKYFYGGFKGSKEWVQMVRDYQAKNK